MIGQKKKTIVRLQESWSGELLVPPKTSFCDWQTQITETLQTYCQRIESEERIQTIELQTNNPLLTCIDHVIFINLDTAATRKSEMIQELERQSLRAKIYRLTAIRDTDGIRGCYLSHLHAIAWAAQNCHGGNVLILEDDFRFAQSPNVTNTCLEQTDKRLQGRWDVVHMGQFVHEWRQITDNSSTENDFKLFQTLHSTTGSGYLIHPDYIRILAMKFHQALQSRQAKPKFECFDYQDQLQIYIQKHDIWLSYLTSLGYQEEGTSTISKEYANNSWRCNRAGTLWFDSQNKAHRLICQYPIILKTIAVILQDTPNLEITVASIIRHFMKPHPLVFYILADHNPLPDNTNTRYYYQRSHDSLKTDIKSLETDIISRETDYVFYFAPDIWFTNSLSLPTDQPILCTSTHIDPFAMFLYTDTLYGGNAIDFFRELAFWHKNFNFFVVENDYCQRFF